MKKKGLFERFKTLFIRYETLPPDSDDLNAAILAGDEDEVKRILKAGQNPNEADDVDRYPLHFAGLKNRFTIMPLLIMYGGDINLVDHEGNTALMVAVNANNSQAARTLINHGIDYFLQNNKGHCALDLAIFAGHTKMINLFLQRLKELELVIFTVRKEKGAKYSRLSKIDLGVDDLGPGGRVQSRNTIRGEISSGKEQKKTLPELEMEHKRLLKLLKDRGVLLH